jgi:hypothetical protein
MKNIFLNFVSIIATASLLLASCTKDETKVIFKGGTPPVLSANVSDSIPLPITDTTGNAVTFSWTNPEYQFSNGISSLNVTYYLQIDTAGANFSSPNIQTVAINSDLSTTFTVSSLNKVLANGLLFATGAKHTIEVRLESFLGTGAEPLYSNPLTFTVTPFAPPPKIVPPSNGQLFIVGDATPGGWPPLSNDPSVEKFTEVSPTLYKITIALNGGKEYKLVAIPGQWTEQWSVKDADTLPNGGDFVLNGANCIAPATSGVYDIVVNFQLGKFTVTPH